MPVLINYENSLHMKNIFLIYFTFSCFIALSQNKQAAEVLEEGKLLYRLEKGSWYGTDDMMARFVTKKDSVGGYVSYETSDNKIYTTFFSRFDQNVILVRYQFDKIPKPEPISVDTLNNDASDLEKDLISLWKDAQSRAVENSDSFFTFYENTSLNFIPLIIGEKRRVFVLTGPQTSGEVILGNDYILNYSRKNKFRNKSKIHNSILFFPFKSEDEQKPIETTIHSHVLTDYITSTDICTLLLYKDYVEWKQHYVISKKIVSIFNLEKETLFIMKRKAWDRILNQ